MSGQSASPSRVTYPDAVFVEAVREEQDDFMAASTRDVADRVGCHLDTARRRLRPLAREGRLETVLMAGYRWWRPAGWETGEAMFE